MPPTTRTPNLARRLRPRLGLAMVVRMVQTATPRAAIAARR